VLGHEGAGVGEGKRVGRGGRRIIKKKNEGRGGGGGGQMETEESKHPEICTAYHSLARSELSVAL